MSSRISITVLHPVTRLSRYDQFAGILLLVLVKFIMNSNF